MTDIARQKAIHKGSILIDQGRFKEAEVVFKDQLMNDPTDDHVLYLLALTQYHILDQQKQSLHTINEALKYETEHPAYFQLKALILSDLKKPKLAIEEIDRALQLNPSFADAYATKAYIFSGMEKWPDAEKSARDALALNADNAFAANILSHTLRMQNRLDESADLASDILAKDPDDSLSHANAGWVYLNRKDYKKAEIHFREALRLDPIFEPARAGMLEVLKSKSMVYRLFLRYKLFMSQQTQSKRLMIVIGIYIVFRVISKNFDTLFQGPMAIVGYGLIAFFYLFFFWTWLAGGIGNLLVLSDTFARHALNKREKLDAVFVGGTFLSGLVFLMAGVLLDFRPLLIFGGTLILSAIPFAVTFVNSYKAGTYFYGSIGGLILVSGSAFAINTHFHGDELPTILTLLLGLSLLLFVACTWLAAFGFLRE